MGEALGVIFGLSVLGFVFWLIIKSYNTFSPEGVKERKTKEYRFGYFDEVTRRIFNQCKRVSYEDYVSTFESPIKNQVEKIGYFKIEAFFNKLSQKNPYSIKVEVKMGSYSANETSIYVEYLSKEFCETELSRIKKKITESEKYKQIFKSLLIR